MKRICHLIGWVLAVGLLLPTGAWGSEDPDQPLDEPKALEPRVEFWVDVIGRRSVREVLVHDQDRPERVFAVLILPERFHARGRRARQWIAEMEAQYQRAFRDAARALRSGADAELPPAVQSALHGVSDPAGEAQRLATAIRTQQGLREVFAESLRRSGLYMETVRSVFREEGLPADIAYLPHLESGYNPRAVSRVGAKGLWQFTRATGRRYLTINDVTDQRLDPYLATRAAARYLREAEATLGCWGLAITAYNYGINGMRRAVSRHGRDLMNVITYHDGAAMGFAARNFYAEFLAVVRVMKDPDTYFGRVVLEDPWQFGRLETDAFVEGPALARHLGCEVDELAELNPALSSRVWRDERWIPPGTLVRVPPMETAVLEQLAATLPPEIEHPEQMIPRYHRVRRGETLSHIASMYKTTVSNITRLNALLDPHRIRVGQRIEVPRPSD